MKFDVIFGLEEAGWPVLLVDEDSVIRQANPAAVQLFGPALDGEAPRLSALWPNDNGRTAEKFPAEWERSPAASMLLKFRTKGGMVESHSTSICAINREGRKLLLLQLWPEPSAGKTHASETNLAQKQKLDCALQLARTVSLDFNNALTSILGHTSLLLSKVDPNHPWRSSLIEVEKSAARAAEIANDLGTFSRQEKETRSHADGNLNVLVQRSMEFCEQSATQPVSWNLQLEHKLFAARLDEAKMQQALMKIFENALQSLNGPGRISVQTRNVELSQSTQDRNVQLAAGSYVCVEISDNGCGIEAEVLPRIFEPFFTTKGGSHRGLGLAWVYGIVTNNGGGVAISSQAGVGTSVRVYLPAEKRIIKNNGVPTEDLSGTQTVLMVDDEDLLLTMGQTVLSAFGYRVLTASSGQRALELLTKPNEPVDLVVTDLVMPAMSGRELVEHVHRLSPATRVLCTSGCVWPVGQQTNGSYLQKPFTSQELLLKVKQCLGHEAASDA